MGTILLFTIAYNTYLYGRGAVVAQVIGHRPGYREITGSMLKQGLTTTVVSLSKKLYPRCSGRPAVKPGTYCVIQSTAEEQPWLMLSSL